MPYSPTPLDRLLSVLKTPALAGDLALQSDLWTEIRRQAETHRFSGLLAHSTSAWLPASERPWRDQVLMACHQRHHQRLAALGRLTDGFRNEGVPCVSLKGPLLAERYYAQPFLRPCNDLDLLIRESDIGRAVRLMGKLDFRLEGRYPWSVQRHSLWHLVFVPSGGGPRVEIHYHLIPYDLVNGDYSEESTEFMDRSVKWNSPAIFESSVLSAADDAFYNCIHAAHHAFQRLRWLYDTLLIAKSLTAPERASVRELAVRHGQQGSFVAAAMASQELFRETLEFDSTGFPVPWLWTRLKPHHTRRMVERVDGSVTSLREMAGYKLDLCRMAGSPAKATLQLARLTDRLIRKTWYDIRHRSPDPNILARTLPC